MLIIKHTLETKATCADIWRVWQDVNNWNTWDHGIEYSILEKPFEKGAKGKLKPKGGPISDIIFTVVEPLKCFVVESKLLGAKIMFSHYLQESNGRTQVTHQIEMNGPLAFLFAFLIGRKMKRNLPSDMESMIKKVETNLQ